MAVNPFNYAPQSGVYEVKTIVHKRSPKPFFIWVILLLIILTILLSINLVNRPTPYEIDEFNEKYDNREFEVEDVVYVRIYAHDINVYRDYIVISTDRGGSYYYSHSLYLHPNFKKELVEGQTYVCQLKIFKYATEYHDPGEFSLRYMVREVYLDSEFENQVNNSANITISIMAICVVLSLMFSSELRKKIPHQESERKLGQLILLFCILLALWSSFRFFINSSFDVFDGRNLIIYTVADYLIFMVPLLYFVVDIEKRPLGFKSLGKIQLVPVILALFFVSISFTLDFFLGWGFIQIFFANEVLGAVFNYNNFTIPQIIIYFAFFFGVVAFVEEMVFRWFFATRFQEIFGFDIAILLSSILFGVSHIPIGIFAYQLNIIELAGFVFIITLIGIQFGYFYLKTKSLLGVIIWHGLWDFLVSVIAFQYIEINFMGWQGSLALSLLIAIVVFMTMMFLMSIILNYKRKSSVTRSFVPFDQTGGYKEVVEVGEIPKVPVDQTNQT